MARKGYRSRRNFDVTTEPEGGRISASSDGPVFVIQQHHARSEHFDFRLEVNGTLVSWAVPKGLSTDPREKRLAIRTEDHPLEYAEFEGVIPEGEYGAGPVLIWDRGTYENITEKDGEIRSADRAVDDGHLLVRLSGQKLSGGYALQRLRDQEEEAWLIIKMKDEDADARRNPTSTQPESVVSGRTIDELEEN